jgi:hypothetical protein
MRDVLDHREGAALLPLAAADAAAGRRDRPDLQTPLEHPKKRLEHETQKEEPTPVS